MNAPIIYKMNVFCGNCFNIYELDIPYKTESFKFIFNKECKFCGCNGFLRIIEPQKEEIKD